MIVITRTANENGVYTVTLTSEEASAGETVRVIAIVSAGGDDFVVNQRLSWYLRIKRRHQRSIQQWLQQKSAGQPNQEQQSA